MSNYTQDNIQTLSPLEAIRKKKGMYFGSNNSKAISHVAKEIISNSIDEFLAGYATTIDIAVSEKQNYVQITDNGRGIPVEKLEDVFTKPHTTGKEKDGGGYATSGGINGIGTKLATATGRIDCIVLRDGKTAIGYYEYGKPFETKIEKTRKKNSSTTVKWQPHKETFDGNGIEYEPINTLCRELSYITPNLTFKLLNVDTNKSATYKSSNIGEYINYLNAGKLLSPIMTYTGVEDTVKLDLAVAWNEKTYQEKSYINIIPTNDGGTHMTAFKSTFTRQWNNYFSTSHKGDDLRQGLIVVLSIKTTEEAVFSGQSKDKLDMPSITPALNSLLVNAFAQFFKTNESFFKEFNKALKNKKDRQEVAELMNSLHKKSFVKQDAFSEISSKYTGCFNDKNIELFLGEGESAATPIALVKDSNNQATYELKGKLKNIFEKPITEAMQSQEIKELIQILGKPNEAEKKFSKIIIASDADHDGSHIALLILGFLATFYPNLLQKDRVYRLVTPILMARKGENYEFAYEESSEWSHNWASKGYEIVRFKGLGQINLNTIKPFIVDNPQRKLAQYNVDDWEAFYESLTVALSSDRIIDRKELLIGVKMSDITANNLIQDLISYGNYYNEQRAIPSIYDGLKPSQRKILYAAYLVKAFSTKAHVKFSKLSGTVTEFYHHGDNALDGTIIRMAQGFKMGNPLIDIEGNRGSQARLHKSNAGASAPRYLMVKTTALADKLIESIKTDTAVFSLYEEDPQYLWIGLPAFLLFRQKGIGTGTATNVPSFTLESVEKLTEELIKLNGDISAEQIANILIPYAEQQPILVNKSNMPNIFAQNGKTKSMRFRAKIEDKNGKLVATNFPIGVSPFMVVENIKKNLANVPIFNNITKVQEISGIGSNNTALTGLELYYKKGTNTKELINFLFVKTSLESSDAVTLTLVNSKGKAAELSYPEALKEWFEIAVEKSYHIIDIKLSTIESKLTRQKALYIGAINALEIVELIQSSTDRRDAENKLVEKYNITKEYAEIILGLKKLHQLTKLETSEIEAEMLRLEELMLYWISIRDDESNFKQFMISESKIGIKGNGGVHMEDSKIAVPKFAVNEDFYYKIQNQKNGLKTIKTSEAYTRGWNKASKDNPIHYMQGNRVIRLDKAEPDITDVIDILDTEYFYVINATTGMVKGNTSDKLHTTKDKAICGFDVDLLVKSNTTANAYIAVETNMGNAQVPLDTIRLTNFSDKAVGVKLIKLRDGEKIEKAYFSNASMGAAYSTGRAINTKKRK